MLAAHDVNHTKNFRNALTELSSLTMPEDMESNKQQYLCFNYSNLLNQNRKQDFYDQRNKESESPHIKKETDDQASCPDPMSSEAANSAFISPAVFPNMPNFNYPNFQPPAENQKNFLSHCAFPYQGTFPGVPWQVPRQQKKIVAENDAGSHFTVNEQERNASVSGNPGNNVGEQQPETASQEPSKPDDVQSPTKEFKCDGCDKIYTTTHGLWRHKQVEHLKISMVLCTECGKSYTRKDHMLRHLRIQHLKIGSITCPYCSKVFYRKDKFKLHLKRCQGLTGGKKEGAEGTQNDEAAKSGPDLLPPSFYQELAYANAQSTDNKKDGDGTRLPVFPVGLPYFLGPTQGTDGNPPKKKKKKSKAKANQNDANLGQPMGDGQWPTKPPPNKTHKCDMCDKAYSTSHGMWRHKQVEHLKCTTVYCTHCTKSFTRKDLMQRHLRTEHLKTGSITCPNCGKVFYRRDKFTMHYKKCSGGKIPVSEQSNLPPKENNPQQNPESAAQSSSSQSENQQNGSTNPASNPIPVSRPNGNANMGQPPFYQNIVYPNIPGGIFDRDGKNMFVPNQGARFPVFPNQGGQPGQVSQPGPPPTENQWPTKPPPKKTHKCDLCEKAYSTSHGLWRHKQIEHLKCTTVYCPHCNKSFTRKDLMQRHIRIEHLKIGSMNCPTCDKVFWRKDKYNIHCKKCTGPKIPVTMPQDMPKEGTPQSHQNNPQPLQNNNPQSHPSNPQSQHQNTPQPHQNTAQSQPNQNPTQNQNTSQPAQSTQQPMQNLPQRNPAHQNPPPQHSAQQQQHRGNVPHQNNPHPPQNNVHNLNNQVSKPNANMIQAPFYQNIVYPNIPGGFFDRDGKNMFVPNQAARFPVFPVGTSHYSMPSSLPNPSNLIYSQHPLSNIPNHGEPKH